jgi:hypothetical protein
VLELLCAIYALYGVVFGAGSVARDRTDGTFEAELAMAVPRWMHGAARWIAGSLVLGAFLTLSVLVYDGLAGVGEAGPILRHGLAATTGTTAVGLLSVGRASLRGGFGATLAIGLTTMTFLFGIAFVIPGAAPYVPIASVASDGNGWIPLALSGMLGALSVVVFTWRSARS